MSVIKQRVAHIWITLTLGLLSLLATPAEAFLDVFLDQHEMVKLMGMDAELFFVRHGVVNHYALTFVIPVPEQVDDLTFSWQSLVDIPIRYAISIEYESQLGGLLTPHINVPVLGEVPIERSTFTIHLPCTGNVSEEVPVGIHLEIDGYPHFNHTKLTFKRNKICIKDDSLLEAHPGLTQESAVFKLIVFAFTFLLVSSVILVTCYCRGSLSSRDRHTKVLEISPQTSYTIDESSSCSASSSLSSRTMTTMAKSTTSRHNHHPHQHHQLHPQQQQRQQYDNVQGFLRPQSIAASCSSLYETIVETGVNKFPMQTMHSNKTCGACCSMFGTDQTLYDGVTIAGLVLPPSAGSNYKSKDRRSMGQPAIYDQPEEATIRWPAPPLFTIEDEQQRVKQNPLHCYTTNNNSHQTLKHESRSNTTPGGAAFAIIRGGGGVGGFEGNPFRGGLWNADAASMAVGGQQQDAAKDSCTYYEPTTFVNQHL